MTQLPQLVRIYVRERVQAGTFALTTAPSVRCNLFAFCRHVGDIAPKEIVAHHVESWLGSVPAARATTRHRFSQVKGFTRWLIRRGLLDADPTVWLKPPRQPRPVPRGLPPEDIGRLLAACPGSRARFVVLAMAQMGLRAIEVARIEVGDLDVNERALLVHGKGGVARLLPVPQEAWQALVTYLVECPVRAGYLVRSQSEPWKGISANRISKLLTQWMRAAGVNGSGHGLRHSMAGDLLRRGVDIRTLQHALGHSSLSATSVYLPWVDLPKLRTAMEGRHYLNATG